MGSYLSLVWQNTSSGGAPTSLLLEVEGSIVATLPLGVTEAFSFAGVPTGTHTFTVRAVNASGMSAPSNPVTLTFPGSTSCAAPPLPPSNVTATTSGNFASMTWQPPQGGATATSYVVNVTGSFTGQLPTASLGIAGTVAPGTYVVTVQAVNPCGVSAATAPVTITVG